MLKKYKTLLIFFIILIITGCYKALVSYLLPNLDTYLAKLIEEGLQALTVLLSITVMKLWPEVGGMNKISKESMLLMLPIIIFSFLPLFNGLVTYKPGNILIVAIFTVFIGLSEELASRGVILSALIHKGKVPAIVLSSLIFGSLHLMNLFKGAGLEETLIQIAFAAGFGLTMAVVRCKTKLLLPQILVHALWDFNSKMSKDDFASEGLETVVFISLILVILWGIFLTLREWKSDSVKQKELN